MNKQLISILKFGIFKTVVKTKIKYTSQVDKAHKICF